MAMKWKLTEVPLEHAKRALIDAEPFAVVRTTGGASILCKELVDVPFDPSKATEHIGTLAEMPSANE